MRSRRAAHVNSIFLYSHGQDATLFTSTNIMPDYDAILSLVDKILYKYKCHYLYDDLRSHVIVRIIDGKLRVEKVCVLACVRKQLRKEASRQAIDIDAISEADHPLTRCDRVATMILADECESLYTERQRMILDLLVNGYSIEDVMKTMQLSHMTVRRELHEIRKIKK